MARYIKANPLVAEFLQVENDRNTVKDGNYLLWLEDIGYAEDPKYIIAVENVLRGL